MAHRPPSIWARLCRTHHAASGLSFDILTSKTAFQNAIIDRARTHPSLPFQVAAPEDLIVIKLIANRHKDQRDLIELAALPGIDWEYVEREAEVWDVGELLAQLRAGGG